jgi:small subunit ribosomal protein S20
MANHKSSIKRIRSTKTRTTQNKYHGKTMRNAIKTFRTKTDKTETEKDLPKMLSMIDRLAKKNVIHKNKAANLKSKLTKKVNKLKAAQA